jgi:NADPH:quinone reductase
VIKVSRSTVIDAPIDSVWAIVRDFNSHANWHPAIARSVIENGEASDQVGCVRAFSLKDGNRLREQLITLSDEDCISTYCILDSTIPLKRYVATLRLKPVTDGNRTYCHWQSTFDTPPGQERALADAVGNGVYDAGFAALREYLKIPAAQKYLSSSSPAYISGTAQSGMEADAVVVTKHGDAAVMVFQKVTASAPQAGEVRIRQRAIGVNFIDVYVRTGAYAMLTPPGVPGMEAAGDIIDVGPGVTHFMSGDRVAYACPPVGAYASVRTMSANQLVRLPDSIGYETAAALMLKGMTAEYLLHRTCHVRTGDTVLVHSAAGGVGALTCQWARSLGATVIGTVGSAEKARVARELGCEFPIVTEHEYRFADEVNRITNGRGAQYIFDGIGGPAFEESFKALAMCGHIVSFGQAGGPMNAIDSGLLSSKSATLTRPVLFHYTAERSKLLEIASNVFAMVERGALRVPVNHRYPLSEAAQAHRDLEARKTTGAIVLLA